MIKNIFPLIYIKNKNFAIKNKAILCLENFYFKIFKVNIENVINEDDRILKIEDRLEIIFPKYNSSDFILKYELIGNDENYENLVIYILEKEKIDDVSIFDTKTKYNFISIIPSFFKVREYKEYDKFYNFDISPNGLIISKYEYFKLEDISLYQNDLSFIDDDVQNFSYHNIINSHLANIEDNYKIIFTGNEPNFKDLNLENKDFIFFDIETINFKKYINFLPQNLQNKYFLYNLNSKFLIFILGLIIFTIFSYIFLLYKISYFENRLIELQTESSRFEEDNKNIRLELAEIEEEYQKLEKQKKDLEKKDFKISNFFEELSCLCPDKISISSVEFDERDVLNLIGITNDFSQINLFLNNIQNSNKIELLNYDYILNKDKNMEFKLEVKYNDKLEVKNENKS